MSSTRAPQRAARRAQRQRDRLPIPPEVVDAARRSFLHFGVNRTTMSDIARQVGVPRQTLYEFVASRDELVDAVLAQRIKEIADEIPAPAEGSVAEAFVEISLTAIRRARSDEELMNVVATGPVDRVQAVVTGAYPEIHTIVSDLLEPVLSRAADDALLRSDKSHDQAIDWIRMVYLALITQPEIDAEHERDLVEGFLLPSVMEPTEP